MNLASRRRAAKEPGGYDRDAPAISPVVAAKNVSPPGAPAPLDPVRTGPPINILIVDDEPRNLAVLETILVDPDYRIVRAESADKALLALVAGEFALLILDIQMPGMSGLDLAHLIKRRKKTAAIPIIFLTAYYNEDRHMLDGYATGAVDYLHKPVSAVVLRSKVAVFAELHRKQRECGAANLALLAEVRLRRRAEEQLRALAQSVIQTQETERGQLARTLHDSITQLLCGIQFRSQALLDSLSPRATRAKAEASRLRELLCHAAAEAEFISQSLRPSVFDHVGLDAALGMACKEFSKRTGLVARFTSEPLSARLPGETELSVFRIFQLALKNIEQHARAVRVDVCLRQRGGFVELSVSDDGVGFDPETTPAETTQSAGLGLLYMRERARSVRVAFKLTSAPRSGTVIELLIPAAPDPAKAL